MYGLAPVVFCFFFLMMRRPPRSTLFPDTPLFRSVHDVVPVVPGRAVFADVNVGRDPPSAFRLLAVHVEIVNQAHLQIDVETGFFWTGLLEMPGRRRIQSHPSIRRRHADLDALVARCRWRIPGIVAGRAAAAGCACTVFPGQDRAPARGPRWLPSSFGWRPMASRRGARDRVPAVAPPRWR